MQVAAQAPAPARPKPVVPEGWAAALIYVDGAAIYSQPDFDAPVKDYLRYKSRVLISTKALRGTGGMGLFHQVRYSKDKTGYVTDTDIRVASKERKKAPPTEKKVSKAWEKEEQEALGDSPLFFRKYVGAAISMVQYAEKFGGKRRADENMMMYGLRMSGPDILAGFPLDFNLWFSLDKPDFYSPPGSSGKPTGFMMFGDIMAQLPMIDINKTLVTYGLGVMWVFTNYKIPDGDAKVESKEFRIGLDAGLGVGQRFGSYMVRADVKYYYERTQYLGGILSFQGEF